MEQVETDFLKQKKVWQHHRLGVYWSYNACKFCYCRVELSYSTNYYKNWLTSTKKPKTSSTTFTSTTKKQSTAISAFRFYRITPGFIPLASHKTNLDAETSNWYRTGLRIRLIWTPLRLSGRTWRGSWISVAHVHWRRTTFRRLYRKNGTLCRSRSFQTSSTRCLGGLGLLYTPKEVLQATKDGLQQYEGLGVRSEKKHQEVSTCLYRKLLYI